MTDNQARQPQGIPSGGRFAAQAHLEPAVNLGGSPAVPPTAVCAYALERKVVEAVYNAGRGFGRNRFGNQGRIGEAYEAAAAYEASLGEPLSDREALWRQRYRDACDQFEQDADTLDDQTYRQRRFEAARMAGWIMEFRHVARQGG